ncbi:MAG: hypothetical protein HY332_02350 [Chloroflexi bacterium]|nr:hypothetical protein [Chloroflexota bacterium]
MLEQPQPAAAPAHRVAPVDSGVGVLLLLAAYVICRAALGALVNPPYNGPDEAGHVEHVRSLIESGGARITGVEARQPPMFYRLAAGLWLATEGAAVPARLFALRLLSGAAGVILLGAAWAAARRLWPGRPWLAAASGTIAVLAPGHLYLLASVSNDPLAAALSALFVLGILHLALDRVEGDDGPAGAAQRTHRRRMWWAITLGAGAGAALTKLTTLPVLAAGGAALIVSHRKPLLALWRRWAVRAAGALVLAGGLAAYVGLLRQHPADSFLAAAAHFGPLALLRAPVAYVQLGGLAESTRTFWYAYDYAARWPQTIELFVLASAVAASLAAALGLILARKWVPAVLWLAAGAQLVFVAGRFGFADLLQIEMGGAAQAKAFFPAILPLSLLFVAGLSATRDRLRALAAPGQPHDGDARGDRWLALGMFVWLLGLDTLSLAISLWHHYRWWQIGA